MAFEDNGDLDPGAVNDSSKVSTIMNSVARTTRSKVSLRLNEMAYTL